MSRDTTEGGRLSGEDHFIERARERGEEAGQSAASWVFDGNTTEATYRRVKRMLDDGDPAIDGFINEPEWMSGQWAGESINELLGDLIEEAADEGHDIEDDILNAYEEGAHDEFWDVIHRGVERHVGGSPLDDDDDDDFDDED